MNHNAPYLLGLFSLLSACATGGMAPSDADNGLVAGDFTAAGEPSVNGAGHIDGQGGGAPAGNALPPEGLSREGGAPMAEEVVDPASRPALPSDGCGTSPAKGQTTISLTVDGKDRTYDLFVPSSYDPSTPMPLVLHLHAGSTGAALQQTGTGMNETAEAHGFLLAWGEGIGGSWNDGNGEGYIGQDTTTDDVAYSAAVIDAVKSAACVDARRVYATGLSSGGFLSYRIACEAPGLLAAIAPAAAALGIADDACALATPVAIRHFHGTDDGTVPFDGRDGQRGVLGGLELFAAAAGCNMDREVSFQQGNATCERWVGCDADYPVELCTSEGGGHCWPGEAPLGVCYGVGGAIPDLNGNEMIWEFFTQHSLP